MATMKYLTRPAISLLLVLSFVGSIAGDEVRRPRVLGLSHMALFVSDLKKARAFYEDFLGYEEPYVLKREDGSDRIVFIKINDNQYIELFAESPKQDGHLNHVSFFTDSANGMREYLASRGIKVPDKVTKGRIGNSNFNIVDPDGHTVEIVQYEPDSWTRREQGKFLPDTRISTRMAHVGVMVGTLQASLKFYRDVLGFQEFWRGSSSGTELSWVNMRVPDGDDYLELMLYSKPADAAQLGSKNHICLFTPDIKQAVAVLESRPARKNYTKPIEIKVGKNGKRFSFSLPPGRLTVFKWGEYSGGKSVLFPTAPP